MFRTRTKIALAGLAIGALALTGCAADTAAPGGDAGGDNGPINVVVFGGLGAEGILADNANTSVTAAKASVAAINEAGGILGRQVEIQVIDDTADPTVAVTKLRELINSGEKPVAVMNSGPSTIAEAMIPILTQNEIFSFNIGPTATSGDPTQSPFNFDLSPSASDYIDAFVPAIKERGFTKVAILHGSSSYGELFGKIANETLNTDGLTVTAMQGFDNAALDMTPQLAALKESNPDVVVLDAYGAPLGYVLQGFEKLDWDVPVMGNTSVAATGLIANEPPTGLLGTDQVKNITMQVFTSTSYDPDNDVVNKAVDLMAATGPIKSSLIPAYNFDTMFLLKAAAEKAGSLDAAALAEALIDPAVQKAAGTVLLTSYNFTADSHTPQIAADEFSFIKPARIVNGQYK